MRLKKVKLIASLGLFNSIIMAGDVSAKPLEEFLNRRAAIESMAKNPHTPPERLENAVQDALDFLNMHCSDMDTEDRHDLAHQIKGISVEAELKRSSSKATCIDELEALKQEIKAFENWKQTNCPMAPIEEHKKVMNSLYAMLKEAEISILIKALPGGIADMYNETIKAIQGSNFEFEAVKGQIAEFKTAMTDNLPDMKREQSQKLIDNLHNMLEKAKIKDQLTKEQNRILTMANEITGMIKGPNFTSEGADQKIAELTKMIDAYRDFINQNCHDMPPEMRRQLDYKLVLFIMKAQKEKEIREFVDQGKVIVTKQNELRRIIKQIQTGMGSEDRPEVTIIKPGRKTKMQAVHCSLDEAIKITEEMARATKELPSRIEDEEEWLVVDDKEAD